MDHDTESLHGLFQSLQETTPIIVIAVDISPLVAAGSHVVDGVVEFDANGMGLAMGSV